MTPAPLLPGISLLLALAASTSEDASIASGVGPQEGPAQGSITERLAALEARNEELERRIGLLSEELESTALGDAYVPVGQGARGLSPAASKIYSAVSPLSIGGYGEGLYENRQGAVDEADFLRAIVYLGYRFDDRWLLNTEFEFEHAGTGGGGSVSVEFAYLEYFATEAVSLRFGMLLVPMGFVNELHEPTLFYSSDRPELEKRIIPSTWRENGMGFVVENDEVSYRAYVLNGFDGTGFTAEGFRGGRQKGSEALASDLAIVARMDYVGTEGLMLGGSIYHGNSGQDATGVGAATTTIAELHTELTVGAWRARALGVLAEQDDAAELNVAAELDGDESIGSALSGYYLELGHNLLNSSDTVAELIPFLRFEKFNTQEDVPDGFASDPANDLEIWTFGVAYKPHPNLIFKADFVNNESEADSDTDIFRLAMGYVF